MRLIVLMAVQYARLPKDRILNHRFNNENNWIDVKFCIGRRKKVTNFARSSILD